MHRRLILAALLLSPLPAHANQPPGPQASLGLVALLVLLPLITALAGGYAVFRAAGGGPSRWRIGAAVAALLFAAMHEGNAFLVTGVVALLAFVRAGQLLRFGLRARRPKPERDSSLASASSVRLLLGATVLVLVAVAFLGNAAAFFRFETMGESRKEDDITRFVARQLVWGGRHAGPDGQPRFQPAIVGDSGLSFEGERMPALGAGRYRVAFELGPEARQFQLDVVAHGLPFFPYNLLVTLPSYTADETGAIRAIRVHENGVRCPHDAPVIRRIGPDDLREAERRLDAEGD